jgi:TPR repeat protein
LGLLYYKGDGVARDNDKARELFRKAAGMSQTEAMHDLGVVYGNGYGVPRDYIKARDWFQKGADLGDATCMFNVGVLYATGDGIARNYTKAREWYQKAAEAGHASAMYNLGYMFEKGSGGPQDYAKALDWYQKAVDADPDNGYAKKALLSLRRRIPGDQVRAPAVESKGQLSKPYVGRWERITDAGLRETYKFDSDGHCSYEGTAASLQGTYVEEAPGILHLKVKGKVILGEDNGVSADTRLEYTIERSCLILTGENGKSDKYFPEQ